MDATKFLAWWGGILATIVFIWDVWKHVSKGPRLRVTVQTNMEMVNGPPAYHNKALLMVRVVNIGDGSTTIENLGYLFFKKRPWRLKANAEKAAVVNNPNPAQRLPHELGPGGVWIGTTIQEAQIEEWATTGFLYMCLYHSHSKREVRRRVVIRSPKRSNSS